ncbi:MAG: hypothetical protein ABI945_11670 [Nitrospirales bacterium]
MNALIIAAVWTRAIISFDRAPVYHKGDFYSQTDNADNISPRLRLTNVAYTHDRTSLTVGMDWTPVMALHPDLMDFSIMG